MAEPQAAATGRAVVMRCRAPLTVTSPLPADLGPIPISVRVDFGDLLRRALVDTGARLDPTSVALIDRADGAVVAHHLAEEFAHGDAGRLEFVIRDPARRRYEVRFAALAPGQRRPHLAPAGPVPVVGVGDLLRCNAGAPRPVTMFSFRLVDLTGDGAADPAGTWNYYHRPGEPRSGVVCYPRVTGDAAGDLRVGDLVRLARHAAGAPGDRRPFAGTYVEADFGDLTGHGRPDLAFAEWNTGRVELLRHGGTVDDGGWPVWEDGTTVAVPEARIRSLSLADVDGDGVLDLLFNGAWIRNANPAGWPFVPEPPCDLGAGEAIAALDLTGDGRLDLVTWTERPSACTPHPDADGAWPGCDVAWHPRLPDRDGRPCFGPARPVVGLPPSTHKLAAARDGDRAGLLVQHAVWQEITFFELAVDADGRAVARRVTRAEADNPPLMLSDQAWPCACDWDGDGDTDLLVGGGYGWPRLVRNDGSDAAPAWAEPELIVAGGAPVRLLRDHILPGTPHWHNMGYLYPVLADWDGDGLPDLMLPNETNRIFWHRNTGTRSRPAFGPRQQLIVDGYEDDDATRRAAAVRAGDRDLPNSPYPHDPTSPFFWRTGATFGDFTGTGACDLVTHDEERKLTLFSQYVDGDRRRRLRKDRRLRLVDGRDIDDAVVGRAQHWTESFRAVDWNGDGRLDLLYNTAGSGHIYLLANVGGPGAPVFAAPRPLRLFGEPFTPFTIHGPNAWPGDLNGDGRPDLVACVEWSVYPVFAHAALEMARHPEVVVGPPTPGEPP